jgi:hypothetical protein
MYRASTTKSTLPASSFRISASDDRGHVEERHSERAHVLRRRGVIRDHHGDRDGQVAATVAPQQVEQAVILLRREDRHALGHRLVGDRPLQVEVLTECARQVRLDVGERRGQVGAVEHDPLEVRAARRVVGVLVERDDVAVVPRDQGRHRRHDPGLVAAVDDQAGVVGEEMRGGGHASILPCPRHPSAPSGATARPA